MVDETTLERTVERMWNRLYPNSGECFDSVTGIAMVTNEVL